MKCKISSSLLSIILSVFMLITPVVAATDSTITNSGICGENVTWTLDNLGVLTISGKGNMDNYNTYAPWYELKDNIMQVKIEEGVTSVGDFSFFNCDNICLVDLSSTITEIGNLAFDGCSGIAKIDIPSSVTTIKYRAFCQCKGITSITIPDSITKIDDWVFKQTGLKSVIIPESVTYIGEKAFEWCGDLTSVILPSSLKYIADNAFSGTDLETINIPASIISIGNNNFDSKTLTSITVDESSETYKSIDGVLFSKDGKHLISYPYGKSGGTVDYNIPEGTEIIDSYAFQNGEHYGMSTEYLYTYVMDMKSIYLPDSMKTIENNAFKNCRMTNLYLRKNIKQIRKTEASKITNLYITACSAPIANATAFNSVDEVHVPANSIGYDINPWALGTVIYDLEDAHIWETDYSVDKEATCTSAGQKSIHCEACNSSKDGTKVEIPTLEHDILKVDAKESTCEECGNVVYYTCNRCNKLFSDTEGITEITKEYITTKPIGHTLIKIESVSPTCTTVGYGEYYKCANCDKLFSDVEGQNEISVLVEIPIINHTFGEWNTIISPTCTESGEKQHICYVCNYIEKESIDTTGHTGGKATCSTKAICSACGEEYGNLNLDVHEKTKTVGKKEATCSEDGYTGNIVCKDCSKTVETGKIIQATGHQWDTGTVTTPATEVMKGVKTYTCTVCNEIKTEEIPAMGNSTGNSMVNEPAGNNKELKVGDSVMDKKTKAVYKVTSKNTMEYRGVSKKTASVSIPSSVTVNGVKYQVTSIAAKAFKGNKKLKKVVIPATVRRLGKQTFYGCKNLKKIIIKTKYLTKKNVGAKAFKGINAKATIKVPKKQLKSYKKMLKTKGVGKKVKIKK